MTKKVAYIVSDIEYALAFEWLVKRYDRKNIQLVFILLRSSAKPCPLSDMLHDEKIETIHLAHRNSTIDFRVLLKLTWLLFKLRPHAVHCHMRRANLLGLTAAKFVLIKNRIYTRHFSTQNHVYYPHAVKTDRLINKLATTIVAPSTVISNVLIDKEMVPDKKVKLIHHGFDLDYFRAKDDVKVHSMKSRLNIEDKQPVIGVISRFIELKGYQFIIPAFEQFISKHPNAVLLIANARGPYEPEVKKLLSALPESSWRTIDFEKDLANLYHCMDFFVHTPIDPGIEAFGQVYVEALAAGVPSVFTLSGIAHTFIKDRQNALVVDYSNAQQINEALQALDENVELRQQLVENGQKSVQPFNLESFVHQTMALYD